MRTARVGTLALLVAAAIPSATLAQDPTASEVALARRLYGEGLAHARAERWAEAKEAFAQSLELAPRPATRLNLATAQLQTGELVAAAENYRRYLQEAERERHRDRARALLAELTPRIPTIHVEIGGLHASDRVELDGDEISQAALGEALPVDPGAHTIRVRRAGRVIDTHAVTLAEGERKEIALRVPRLARTPAELAAPRPSRTVAPLGPGAVDPGDGEGGIFTSPVFWIAAAVVIGGAIIAGILLSSSSENTIGPHYEGNAGSIPVR